MHIELSNGSEELLLETTIPDSAAYGMRKGDEILIHKDGDVDDESACYTIVRKRFVFVGTSGAMHLSMSVTEGTTKIKRRRF